MGQGYLFDQSPLAEDSKKRINFSKLTKLVESFEKPVILLEGSRHVPENDAESLMNRAVRLEFSNQSFYSSEFTLQRVAAPARRGGTRHIIRICHLLKTPVIEQTDRLK